MDIEKALKKYRFKKSLVETTLARIEQYKFAIAHPEMWVKDYIPTVEREIGMPGAPLRNTSSPVEKFMIEKELSEEMIKEWIREDESRIFIKKLEVEQIELALDGITSQEKYIIELKYFNGLSWKEIELNYNEKFKQRNYVGYEWLKKVNKEAISKVEDILMPFYDRFNIVQ